MSDHISGPRAVAGPAADITDVYAFPSPERPGHLVLVMNVHPFARPTDQFSDALIYRLRLRPVSVAATGRAAFDVGTEETSLSFTFAAPIAQADRSRPVQAGRCATTMGVSVSLSVNDEQGGRADGLRVFAGARSDPFFIDLVAAQETLQSGRLSFKPVGRNAGQGLTALSIVAEVDCATLPDGGPMFGVVAETLAAGKLPIRIERCGRPEIKNITLGDKRFDAVNRDLEIRDLYNMEDAFHLGEDYLGAFRARFDGNLAYFDRLDGKTDWPLREDGAHPLTELLLADFLVVDVSKPYAEDSYFEIERAMLQGRAHETCGGRSLNDDVMDTIYTLYINAGNGPRISDGVDAPDVPTTRIFPYLVAPTIPQTDVSSET